MCRAYGLLLPPPAKPPHACTRSVEYVVHDVNTGNFSNKTCINHDKMYVAVASHGWLAIKLPMLYLVSQTHANLSLSFIFLI